MTQYYVESIDELEHYGVLGMKWGVRRARRNARQLARGTYYRLKARNKADNPGITSRSQAVGLINDYRHYRDAQEFFNLKGRSKEEKNQIYESARAFNRSVRKNDILKGIRKSGSNTRYAAKHIARGTLVGALGGVDYGFASALKTPTDVKSIASGMAVQIADPKTIATQGAALGAAAGAGAGGIVSGIHAIRTNTKLMDRAINKIDRDWQSLDSDQYRRKILRDDKSTKLSSQIQKKNQRRYQS